MFYSIASPLPPYTVVVGEDRGSLTPKIASLTGKHGTKRVVQLGIREAKGILTLKNSNETE